MRNLAIIAGGDLRSWGGGERYVVELSKRLTNNFKITVFSRKENKNLRISDDLLKKILPAKLIFFKEFYIPISIDWLPLSFSGLKMIRGLNKFDTVYIMDHSIFTIGLVLFYLKMKKSHTRIIFGMHSPPHLSIQNYTAFKKLLFPFYKYFYKKIIFKIPNIHVLNSDDYSLLKREKYHGKLFLIPNFIYIKRDKIKINNKKFIILFVGRLSIYTKGLDLLSKISNQILAKNKKIKFHIIGSGDVTANHIITTLTQKYPKNFVYKGFVSENVLMKEYKNAAIFILTSRSETYSLVTLEAQSYGLPVVSFCINGPKNIIKNFSGSLVKPFDINLFTQKILEYYDFWKEGNINIKYKQKIANYVYKRYSDIIIIPKIEKMLKN